MIIKNKIKNNLKHKEARGKFLNKVIIENQKLSKI